MALSLFQSKLFLDALDRTRLEVGVVHRQNGLLAVSVNFQVRTLASLKSRPLSGQPAFEFFAVHRSSINIIVYLFQPGFFARRCG
jgi:hypothetical protein